MKKNILLSIVILITTISIYASEPSKVELLKRIQQLEKQVTLCSKTEEEKYTIPFTRIENELNTLAKNKEKNYNAPQTYKSDVPTWLLK